MKTNFQDLLSRRVSLYTRAANDGELKLWSVKLGDPRLVDVLNSMFTDKENIELVAEARRILAEQGEDVYRDWKKFNMPCYTIGGTFGPKHEEDTMTSLSYLMGIDIDHIEESMLEPMKKTLSTLPYVLFAALSVSGKGLFAIIPYKEGCDHRKVWNALHDEMLKYGIKLDTCSDPCRLRFFSYDKHPYLNCGEVEIWEKELEKETKQTNDLSAESEKTKATAEKKLDFNQGGSNFSYGVDFINDDLFCAKCIDVAIDMGYKTGVYVKSGDNGKTGNMQDWLGHLNNIALLPEPYASYLAHKLSEASSGYVSWDDVEKTFKKIKSDPASDQSRGWFTRYFSFLRGKLGEDWWRRIYFLIGK